MKNLFNRDLVVRPPLFDRWAKQDIVGMPSPPETVPLASARGLACHCMLRQYLPGLVGYRSLNEESFLCCIVV